MGPVGEHRYGICESVLYFIRCISINNTQNHIINQTVPHIDKQPKDNIYQLIVNLLKC